MAEATSSPTTSERHRSDDAPRGDRAPGPREGGFRIRLSDNEMRSARALQEAFGLRSTVAVLGFALRTLGQQLEEGKLDALVSEHKAQAGAARGAGGGRPEGGRRERPEGRGGGAGGRWQEGRGGGARPARVDPFARPSRPAAAPEPAEASELGEDLAGEPAVADLSGEAPQEATESITAESGATESPTTESAATASSSGAEPAADAPEQAAATLSSELPAPEPAEA